MKEKKENVERKSETKKRLKKTKDEFFFGADFFVRKK